MSNSPQGLNLIQRAVKRLSDEGLKADHSGDRAVDAVPLPDPITPRVAEPARAPRIETSFRTAAPSEAEASRREIRLNYAKLRQDNIVTPDNPTSATHDEFRAIKRKLLAKARDGKSEGITRNVVMVTSALPGEGKTFTTINLVISLAAERNLQVLLIDADVVKPSVREFFIGEEQRGLTDLLNGSTQRVNEVVHRCADIPNLSVMFAGRHDTRSPELMASRRMAEIFAELSAQYPDRIIVIDSPPVIASPEPTALAMHVHQVILVVAAEHASRHQIEESLERISACRNISVVFNKSPHWRKAGSSYYYYYRRQQDADTPAG